MADYILVKVQEEYSLCNLHQYWNLTEGNKLLLPEEITDTSSTPAQNWDRDSGLPTYTCEGSGIYVDPITAVIVSIIAAEESCLTVWILVTI